MVLRAVRSPYLWALLLASLLSSAWAMADWSNLAALRLPDTDDAMRLQQVRDWIGGQATGDLIQHRLAGGLPMHWSRIGDLVPAALILILRPFAGVAGAELAAVVLWPLLQFATLLMLVRSIAHVLAPRAATTAMVLAALAYPATTLFLPGRIDHHALQLLLVLVQLRALVAPRTFATGAIAGGAVAIGAGVGLETLPFAVLTGAVVAVGWLRGDGRQLTGFGLALAIGLLALLPLAGQGGACDTIAPLAPVTIAAALALAALGRITHHRPAFAGATAVALAIIAWPPVQPCLSGPYRNVDPLVARLWLAQVAEAQPLLVAPVAQGFGYAGLLLVGLAASAWLAWQRGRDWPLVLGYQAVAFAITLAQLRGTYVGAALAVLPMAVLLAEQRARRRIAGVMALWIAGTGLSYPLIAGLAAPKAAQAAVAPSCTTPEILAQLNALPAGRVMAGIDLGAYAIAGTHHAMIAAPYHRNNAGNAAMYRFFLGSPAQARRIASEWRTDYVVMCPGALGDIRAPAGSIAAGAIPGWLTRRSAPDAVPAIFTTYPRLSETPRAR
ncbi:MAG: hypothetical protein V4537_01475 [Pseudomonadota bacterium]